MEQTYKDHKITLTHNWRFAVEGPLFNPERQGAFADAYDSLADAKQVIDARLVAAAKQKKAEADYAEHVLDESGRPQTVRGVHASHGTLLGVGDTGFVYPANSDVLRDRLTRLAKARAEVDALVRETQAYRISIRRAYGRTKPEEYDALLQKFSDELAEKIKKADAL